MGGLIIRFREKPSFMDFAGFAYRKETVSLRDVMRLNAGFRITVRVTA